MTVPKPTPRPRAFADESDLLVIKGGATRPARDFYHALIRNPWWVTMLVIVANFLVANAIFAVAYALVGGVHGMREGSLLDAFFFSVQTIGTIGYGAMYPESSAAHTLVAIEVLLGILMTALATGLVFTKFSTPQTKVFFSRNAVICLYDGTPTLMLRVGNQRSDHVIDARLRLTLSRTEKTQEGETFYRNRDLQLVRSSSPTMRRGTSVMHTIDATSPLFGCTPESLHESEAEIVVSIIGIDGTTMQPVFAGSSYFDDEVLFGHHLVNTITELPDGRVELDISKFHDTRPGEPTEVFPYPRQR